MVKLSKGQAAVLAAAALPMIATGVAGAVATFVNMRSVLPTGATALGLVAAGEGATLVAALVALAVTLMGQHTPAVVRLGMWMLPVGASALGIFLAPSGAMAAVMGATPMAMTVAGEGITLVARRIVAFRTGVDLEQQRRSGLLLWHANRAANGSGFGKRVSRAAVWRLTKQFAATDNQLSVQLGEIQRYRVGEGADNNLAAVLSGGSSAKQAEGSVRPAETLAVAPAPQLPELPRRAAGDEPAPLLNPEALDELPYTIDTDPADSWDFVAGVLAEAEAHVAADPQLKLMTTAEVAAQRGVSPGTVRSWVSRGKLSVADRDERGGALFNPAHVAAMI